MFKMEMQWKEFNVDLETIDQKLRAEQPSYVGNQASNKIELFFTQDPNAIPMETVTVQVPVQQQAVDSETGELLVDENGEPVMIEVIQDQQVQQPSGEPTVAEQVQAMWDAITAESEEATSYRSQQQIQSTIQALKEGIPAKTWNTMNGIERKLVMGLNVSKAELIAAELL